MRKVAPSLSCSGISQRVRLEQVVSLAWPPEALSKHWVWCLCLFLAWLLFSIQEALLEEAAPLVYITSICPHLALGCT